MLFHVIWEFTDQSEEAFKRSLEIFSKWQPPAGADFKGFYGFADSSGGVAIVEVDSAATLHRATAPFAPWLTFTTHADRPDRGVGAAIAGEADAVSVATVGSRARWRRRVNGDHARGAPARGAQPRAAAGGAALPDHAGRTALPADPLRHPRPSTRTWRLEVGGRVARSRCSLSLAELKERPSRTLAVTMECAGNGRGRCTSRARSASRGCSRRSARRSGRARRSRRSSSRRASTRTRSSSSSPASTCGVQGEVEHAYERSLPVAEALRDEVLLPYAINGQPLPPQHGFPVRLLVPSWYGMTHVKWLRSITAVDEPFRGWQQDVAYRLRQSEDEQGTPVTRILPRGADGAAGHPGLPLADATRATRGRACSRAARGRARRRSCASR